MRNPEFAALAGRNETSTFTSEFGHEFEIERGNLLRRRFLWYCGVTVVLGVVAIVASAIFADAGPQGGRMASQLGFVTSIVATLLYAAAFAVVSRRRLSRLRLFRLVYWLIVVSGLLAILSAVFEAEAFRVVTMGAAEEERPKKLRQMAMIVVFGGTAQTFLTHFFACLFLPWTVRECIRPLLPLLVANTIVLLAYARLSPVPVATAILLSPLVGLPGAAVCWLRYSRLRERFTVGMIRGRYTELRRELTDARRIHEALFPAPLSEGAVQFDYLYDPMRQIGGDYLYARPTSDGALNVILMDVTGHGIPAALTVNRLHGELERLFAEHPNLLPGDLLRLLNRYVHLTLANHSVYVTALCLHADAAACTLHYASGGHPPAFLRAVDGTVHELPSTAFVLGACPDRDFDPEPRHVPFHPGDALIAYTDGAIEARDQHGRMLGIAGLRAIVARGVGGRESWARRVLSAVEAHRFGHPADDTLVIELLHALSASERRPPADASGARSSVAAGTPLVR